ncbi:MAG: response regulator [Nannocystaceae bacterium]|nr:response regulator [bacterium]
MVSKVLLVDDDPTTNYLHQRVVKKANAEAELAVTTDGREAVEYLESEGTAWPELILLDINMPRMNGFEFLEAFRSVSARRREDARIVMVTTSVLPTDRQRALDHDLVEDFKGKPLSVDDARELLKLRPVA